MNNFLKALNKYIERIKNLNEVELKISTSQIIVYGFLSVILAGTVLLNSPFATADGSSIGFIDALFTSASAVCVTGLVVVDTYIYWSLFGKIVILLLIQVGGMGFMTIVTVMFVLLGRRITLKERLVIQESFNQSDLSGMVRMAKKVFFGTFIIEGVAAAILAVRFLFDGYAIPKALGFGIFHSVSAFCNAGFDIIGAASLSDYVGDPTVNIVIALLIIVGGIGYSVWLDVLKNAPHFKGNTLKQFFGRLNLHSKVVIAFTGILLGFGMVFFFVSELGGTLFATLTWPERIWASFFQSITPRTAGFFTVNQAKLDYSSKFYTIIMMFIGGSPGGTAGGVKTTTFSVIIISVYSIIRGRDRITAFQRTIPLVYLQKALAVVMMNLFVIITSTMLLSFTERSSGFSFIEMLFEASSATGTVGLTLGITSSLSTLGRIIITICMFIGRVGPLTVAVGLTTKHMTTKNNIHYPDEKVLVG